MREHRPMGRCSSFVHDISHERESWKRCPNQTPICCEENSPLALRERKIMGVICSREIELLRYFERRDIQVNVVDETNRKQIQRLDDADGGGFREELLTSRPVDCIRHLVSKQ